MENRRSVRPWARRIMVEEAIGAEVQFAGTSGEGTNGQGRREPQVWWKRGGKRVGAWAGWGSSPLVHQNTAIALSTDDSLRSELLRLATHDAAP